MRVLLHPQPRRVDGAVALLPFERLIFSGVVTGSLIVCARPRVSAKAVRGKHERGQAARR